MNVARDIAGISLPFAVGVLLTIYAGAASCTGSAVLPLFVIIGISIAASILIARGQLALKPPVIQALIVFSACLCGVLTGMTGLLSETEVPASGLEAIALRFCGRMQGVIDSIPFRSSETGALVKALLTGERSSLPQEMTEAFRDSGASHILALSGLHLGMIYGVLSWIMAVFGNMMEVRRLRSAILIAVCGFYTLATGAGPSIVRAFIFILLGETARLTGRSYKLGHILLTSLLIQLVFSPLSARSVGFQLSYAAMAGIAFIYPWFKGLWPADEATSQAGRMFGRGMKWMWNSLALSISCQITTGPLAYMYFGTFPMHFLLTNLIALPLTGILIPSALLTSCLASAGWYSPLLITVTETLAQAMTWSLHVIATM